MSSEVKEVTRAMEIAKMVADEAGLVFYYIVSTKREGNFWLVQLRAVGGGFVVRINALTGEVVEFTAQ